MAAAVAAAAIKPSSALRFFFFSGLLRSPESPVFRWLLLLPLLLLPLPVPEDDEDDFFKVVVEDGGGVTVGDVATAGAMPVAPTFVARGMISNPPASIAPPAGRFSSIIPDNAVGRIDGLPVLPIAIASVVGGGFPCPDAAKVATFA
uniref:Putative secreted protein n=1 Tax=Anopheles darlingi TaxID=43151 RepID=A0A2M4DC47_ANODA